MGIRFILLILSHLCGSVSLGEGERAVADRRYNLCLIGEDLRLSARVALPGKSKV